MTTLPAKRFNPAWIVGKTVARVELNKFRDGRGGWTSDPVIHFTDGATLRFMVDETESLDYGISPLYSKGRT